MLKFNETMPKIVSELSSLKKEIDDKKGCGEDVTELSAKFAVLSEQVSVLRLIKMELMEQVTDDAICQRFVNEGLFHTIKKEALKDGKPIEVDAIEESVDKRVLLLPEEFQLEIFDAMSHARGKNIDLYKKRNRLDLAEKEIKEKEVIDWFLPRKATPEETEEYTKQAVEEYLKTQPDGYKLTLKDTKSIIALVRAKDDTAEGRDVSKTLAKIIG